MNNGVFLPIEITQREYVSKLLLALELIKRGMPVIIGHKDPVTKLALEAKEPGIFFNKGTMAMGSEQTFALLKKKNFGFAAQDEEAGVIFNNFKDFYIERPSLQSLHKMDFFFTWGDEEYQFLIDKFSKSIVKNYGGLRSCFWGDLGKKFYKSKINHLKKKFGSYILLVSNLATFNSSLGKAKDLKREIKIWGKLFDMKVYQDLFESEKKIFFQYKKIVKLLTNKLNKKVVIRPHPSESTEVWENIFKNTKNVFVKKEHDLLPWILASDFIIQNNCTSAIEASSAGIPVVTYYDNIEDLTLLSNGKENIPNKLSVNINGENQFIEIINSIKEIWFNNKNTVKRDVLLKRKLKDYGTTKAAQNIAKQIIEHVGIPNSKGNENLGKDSIFFDIYELFRMNKFRLKTKSSILDINKRETISSDKIKNDISNLMDITKVQNKIRMKRIGPNTFYIYPLEYNIKK